MAIQLVHIMDSKCQQLTDAYNAIHKISAYHVYDTLNKALKEIETEYARCAPKSSKFNDKNLWDLM